MQSDLRFTVTRLSLCPIRCLLQITAAVKQIHTTRRIVLTANLHCEHKPPLHQPGPLLTIHTHKCTCTHTLRTILTHSNLSIILYTCCLHNIPPSPHPQSAIHIGYIFKDLNTHFQSGVGYPILNCIDINPLFVIYCYNDQSIVQSLWWSGFAPGQSQICLLCWACLKSRTTFILCPGNHPLTFHQALPEAISHTNGLDQQ